MAIACGETAPLLYTAGFSNTLPHSITQSQFPYLTYVVFTFYNDPSVQKHYLAYDAALILVVIVMLLLVASRIIVARTQRYSESARVAAGGRRPFGRFRNDPSLAAVPVPVAEPDPTIGLGLGEFPTT